MGVQGTYKLPESYIDGYKAMGDAVTLPVAAWFAKNFALPPCEGHT